MHNAERESGSYQSHAQESESLEGNAEWIIIKNNRENIVVGTPEE